jgi:hypothetical protein
MGQIPWESPASRERWSHVPPESIEQVINEETACPVVHVAWIVVGLV